MSSLSQMFFIQQQCCYSDINTNTDFFLMSSLANTTLI